MPEPESQWNRHVYFATGTVMSTLNCSDTEQRSNSTTTPDHGIDDGDDD